MSTDALSRIRPAAVAGMFYPDDPQQLKSEISQYLNRASSSSSSVPKAIIVPHAGYIFSAPVAANAYHLLTPEIQKIKQVILLGPSHHLAFDGIATPDADYFATPLGKIKINHSLCLKAQSLDFVQTNNPAHQREHSLEVQLPFLQVILNDFELTPLVVGNCDMESISQLLELLWGGAETLIVISTDLSHFHNYQVANRLDRKTSQAIEQLQPDLISSENACGKAPLNGLLTLARKKQLTIDCLDLRNSADTAGSMDRVVGYGAYAVH
ncbi:Candidate phosphomevalonate decarboxylase; COG1355, Predicted dioxygenase [hydrothermal vent metagenome]|uniref:Candidate phosphomevalonate decarboxylase COG1355, Predicted dioxygenase n=1 Tax=hydrothermal vent metagenome TaxID=652676 RepID=A0A3B0Y332_9ZZZZ